MLMQMFDVLAPIAIITAIGYWLGRSSVGLETRGLSSMVLLVATPALIFHTLTSLDVTPETIKLMSGTAVLCISVAGILALIVLLTFGGPVRSFLPPLMLPNSGNLGLPLVLLAFGPEGLKLGVAYFFVVSLVQHTIGLSIYAGSIQVSAVLRQPLIYSIAAVLLVLSTGIPVPDFVLVTTELLGGMMVPAMLMLLGASLATLQVTDLRPAVLIAVARLVVGIVSAFVVITVLDLKGMTAGVVFLLATMPTAMVNYIYAERYQHNPRQVAGSIVTSTVVTFVCLPVLVWTALGISQDDPGERHDASVSLVVRSAETSKGVSSGSN